MEPAAGGATSALTGVPFRRAGVALLLAGIVPAAAGWVWPALLALVIGFALATRGVDGMRVVGAGAVTTAALLLSAVRGGLDLAQLGLQSATWGIGGVVSAVLLALVGLVVALAGRIPRLRVLFVDERRAGATGPQVARQVLLDIPIGTVLVEEVAFRGLLIALLLPRFGTIWTVVLSSALFGLWHVPSALEMHRENAGAAGRGALDRGRVPTLAATVAVTGASGIVFGVLRLWTGSLLPPAALHWAVNGWGTLVSFWLARRHTAS